jgi:hypothetical protein
MPEQRLRFHQAHSGPVTEQFQHCLEASLAVMVEQPNRLPLRLRNRNTQPEKGSSASAASDK